MRDFLGTYTFYHDQIPLSIYYLMYVPYSALILLACTWICPDKGFLQEPKVYYTPEESIQEALAANRSYQKPLDRASQILYKIWIVLKDPGKNPSDRDEISGMNIRTLSLMIICLLLLAPVTAVVQAEEAGDHQTLTFYLENDIFASTDRDYTNGAKLTWISPDLTYYRQDPRLPKWSLPLIRALPFVNEPGFQRNVSLSLGQSMYTPADIEDPNLIPNERPYAGIAYFAVGFHSKSPRRMDTLEIDLGIVGPHSYADTFQKAIHDLIETRDPKGWEHQLKDEPILNLYFERKWRSFRAGSGEGWGGDVIPYLGAGLGNAWTGGNAGFQIRFGWNLPNDFGTFLIRPGSDTNAPLDEQDPRFFPSFRRFGIHLFGAVNTHLVLRNILLDGNTFQDSHSVDKKPVFADFALGVGLILHRFKISYAYVYQTKEYRTQPHEQAFGSVTLSYSF